MMDQLAEIAGALPVGVNFNSLVYQYPSDLGPYKELDTTWDLDSQPSPHNVWRPTASATATSKFVKTYRKHPGPCAFLCQC